MKKKESFHLHFVGIGGIGMSGIAEVFHNQGYRVTGSDLSESETVKRLQGLGITISIGHRPENLFHADVVVYSSAVKPDNAEWLEAKRRRIPLIRRAEMLGELMRGKIGVAVGGTHGKTTTTTLLSWILTEAKLDPTLVIGGKVNALGGNARLGKGAWIVAEADESDGSFLHLPATYGIVTNIDADHLDHFGDQDHIDRAFVDFVGKIPFYGVTMMCGDDPGVKRCLPRMEKPTRTYGFAEENDYRAVNIIRKDTGSEFSIFSRDHKKTMGPLFVKALGKHNVLNALGASALALEMEIAWDAIERGLKSFEGVKRRFEVKAHRKEFPVAVVDDYGHHPTEVAATLQAARDFWKGRIRLVFQPHRYSRTQNHLQTFAKVMSAADEVILLPIYSAGEEKIEGVSPDAIRAAATPSAQEKIRISAGFPETLGLIQKETKPGDLWLCMGAGSITAFSDQVALWVLNEGSFQ